MRLQKVIWLSLIIPFWLSCSSPRLKSDYCVLFYLPFEVRTYIPVTIKDIERRCDYIKVVTNKNDVVQIKKLIIPLNTSVFDENMVRVKLIFKENTFYVDENGYATDIKNAFYKVEPETFEKRIRKVFHVK